VYTSDDYRKRAEHCLASAEKTLDIGERAKLLELARQYLALANHVSARYHRGTAHRLAEHDPEKYSDDA
jgi:hypothetical protein